METGEHVVVVEQLTGALLGGVRVEHPLYAGVVLDEVGKAGREDLIQRLERVLNEARYVYQDRLLGEPPLGSVDLRIGDARADQIARVLSVEDGEVGRDPEASTVSPENATGHMVERAAPDLVGVLLDENLHAVQHLAGSSVREGHEKDPRGVDAVVH